MTLKDRLVRISADTRVDGTAATLEIISGRSPMPASDANQRLYTRVEKIAGRLGIALSPECRPGVSDANTIAQAGIPVLDGMGPLGSRDHSPDE